MTGAQIESYVVAIACLAAAGLYFGIRREIARSLDRRAGVAQRTSAAPDAADEDEPADDGADGGADPGASPDDEANDPR